VRPVIEVAAGDLPSLPGVAALAAAVLDDPWPESAFRSELAVPGARLWLARAVGGETVGFLATRRVLDALHVLALGVDPRQRRRGVARGILVRALMAETGARTAELEVRAGNAGARCFYEAQGFVAVGRRARYYRGCEDAILMTRTL
jgi:ribosomal protein S18 acetylase RimI-like enzyme